MNTLQQGTGTKTPISPSSTACTGQWFISIQSVIFRTQLTLAKRTKEFWETWFSGTLHFLSAFPPSLGIHLNLVPQTGFHEGASLSPVNCNSGCFRTKLSNSEHHSFSSCTRFTSCYKKFLFRNKSNRKHNSPRCAPFRELMKNKPEDGQGRWFGVFGCRITQEPCKQEQPGALPHPSHTLGVGNPSDLTQLFH